ncbi:MAG: transcriptional regulator TrmB [Candidatus Nomurabacteria bacterium]|nr:transcriptional regulator TrmB [Candidatus Nomurabacteria bacterium]
MAVKEKINSILEAIGLNNTETVILKSLLEHKLLRATEISRKTKLNRTTVYSAINNLIEKGLVTSMDEKKVLIFRSIEPHLLLDYMERQKAVLSQNADYYKEILPEIESKRAQKHIFPKIQFFKGLDGIKQAYEDTLDHNTQKQIRTFTGADAIYNVADQEWVHYYLTKRRDMGIKASVITTDTPGGHATKNKDKQFFRTTKIIPKEYSFDTEIIAYENKISLTSFSNEDPVAVIIEDERISNTIKKIFEYVWNKEGEDKSKIA